MFKRVTSENLYRFFELLCLRGQLWRCELQQRVQHYWGSSGFPKITNREGEAVLSFKENNKARCNLLW